MRIIKAAVLVGATAMLSWAPAWADWVPPFKGNDTGGIIPWSPDNERMAGEIAQDDCGLYGKYAVITTIHRTYGDYISYECRFDRRRRRHAWR
jgi:hypothetical protein